jgi:oligopeptide/dipeptide ABC transporter ATP-binding protein
MALLEVEHLCTTLMTEGGLLPAVDDVSFTVDRGATASFIGESGSGKSTLAMSVMQLLPPGVGVITGGSVRLDGQELVGRPERQLAGIRGRRVSLVPQDPMTALSPVASIGRQMRHVLSVGGRVPKAETARRAAELLEMVHISSPEQRLASYPHQLSGGMLQRVLIAMALGAEPDLVIADEPTSALDVSVQAGILDLLLDMQAQRGMALMLVTHDLGVARWVSDRVHVMYAGRIVESGPVLDVLADPRVPYTQGLLQSMPRLSGVAEQPSPVFGTPPRLSQLPAGCNYSTRCPFATERCAVEQPESRSVGDSHQAQCHYDISATTVHVASADVSAGSERV